MNLSETFRIVNMDFTNTDHGGFLIEAPKHFGPKYPEYFWIWGSKFVDQNDQFSAKSRQGTTFASTLNGRDITDNSAVLIRL